MIKKCEVCGKEFETARDYQKYCSKECRLQQNRSLEKQRTERKKRNESLINAAVEARAMGMTYGQYQAMKTIEMLRGER